MIFLLILLDWSYYFYTQKKEKKRKSLLFFCKRDSFSFNCALITVIISCCYSLSPWCPSVVPVLNNPPTHTHTHSRFVCQ